MRGVPVERLKKIPKAKILAAAILLLAVAFGIVNLLWFRYIRVTFDPLLKNERLTQIPTQEHHHIDDGWTTHMYRDLYGSGLTFTVAVPAYLEFGGNISALTQTDIKRDGNQLVYISECKINLRISPKNWTYVLNISDLSVLNGNSAPERIIGMAVDKDGKPLGHPRNDTESELYQEWLAMYNKFNGPIMEFFQKVKEIYGEEVFR